MSNMLLNTDNNITWKIICNPEVYLDYYNIPYSTEYENQKSDKLSNTDNISITWEIIRNHPEVYWKKYNFKNNSDLLSKL